MAIKTILTPIDFSECSVNALKTALRLCGKSGAHLIILHAIKDPIVMGNMQPEEYTRVFIKETEDKAREQFEALETEIPALAEVGHEFRISHDLVEDAVTVVQRNEEVDLIIMGTRGTSGLKGLLFGSHTYWVIQHAGCPVLTIPEQSVTDDRFDRIALATELREEGEKEVFDLLIHLVQLDESELHILHLTDDSVLASSKADEAWKLESYFKDLEHSYHFRPEAHREETLMEYLEEKEVEMLAVVSKKRSVLQALFHQSLTRKLTFHLKTPLLILQG